MIYFEFSVSVLFHFFATVKFCFGFAFFYSLTFSFAIPSVLIICFIFHFFKNQEFCFSYFFTRVMLYLFLFYLEESDFLLWPAALSLASLLPLHFTYFLSFSIFIYIFIPSFILPPLIPTVHFYPFLNRLSWIPAKICATVGHPLFWKSPDP